MGSLFENALSASASAGVYQIVFRMCPFMCLQMLLDTGTEGNLYLRGGIVGSTCTLA